MTAPAQLVLASTSPWRRELLERLGLPFDAVDPELDETPWHERGLPPEMLVLELAAAKARAVASTVSPDSVILAADQVACVDGTILLKPGTRGRAIEQLGLLQGRSHRLVTGVVLLDRRDGSCHSSLDIQTLTMRPLSLQQRSNYVDREEVLGCAGSYKIEGLGICLFESLDGKDWTAVIGLPLIRVVDLLERSGISILG